MKKIKMIGAILIGIALVYFSILFIFKNYIYPVKYEKYVIKYSKKYGVDKFLIFSIIKKESGFNRLAVSKKKAKGLMQILYTTAVDMAREDSSSKNDDINLFEPEINIQLGVKYIKYLLNKYDGDIYLTICAYNAGLGNVDKWIQDGTIYTDGKFDISKIPFEETKNYLVSVLKYYNRYIDLYN